MASSTEKRVFFDISVDDQTVGRLEIKLFTSQAPRTCENFRALCTGEVGRTPNNKAQLHYKGNGIHRIVRNFMIQGGDITEGDGRGGYSIYGRYFDDEKFELKHSKPYLLSMANKGPNSNSSQFFITTAPAPHCNGKHVVFGEIIKGREVVDLIENLEVDDKSKPYSKVRIVNCGELIKKKKEVKTDEDLIALEEKKKAEAKNVIPEVPKSWLYRDEQNNNILSTKSLKKSSRCRSFSREREHRHENRDSIEDRRGYRNQGGNRKDDIGITVRGRGGVRYQHERSVTPDHWRKNTPSKQLRESYLQPENLLP